MARAKVVPSPYSSFASKSILENLKGLEKQLHGTRSMEDVEYVHQARVASRRLRAALATFSECVPADRLRSWTTAVKTVTRSLGDARDLDVQIEFLKEYVRTRGPYVGLTQLLQRLQTERRGMQSRVEAAVDEFENCHIAEEMRETLVAPLEGSGDDRFKETRVAALGHITARMRELFALEKCVGRPKAIKEHHQMRIAAKRLRYTLEIFSIAYDERLKVYIKHLKRVQDVLGEMHDCDVWSDILSHEDVKDPGINELCRDREMTRTTRYEEFVSIWTMTMEQHIFSDLERELRNAMSRSFNVQQLNEDVLHHKIGLLADIHGNLPALNAVLRDGEERGVTTYLNAGDNLGNGPMSVDIMERLAVPNIINIKGNYDQTILDVISGEGKETRDHKDPKRTIDEITSKYLPDEWAERLGGWGDEARLRIGGKDVLLTHASPSSSIEKVDDSTEGSRLISLARMARADIVIFGHSHVRFDREIEGVHFINPGSVGRPSDGDPRASYAIWDTEEGTVEFRRLPYPINDLLDRMVDAGLPVDACNAVLFGTPIGVPVPDGSKIDLRKGVGSAESVAKGHGYYDQHVEQVRRNSATLFQDLKCEHGTGERERLMMECAATLHDIGWSWGGTDHDRSSFDLIVMDPDLPFKGRSRLLVANIARYHRGPFPKDGHGNYAILTKKEKTLVMLLASILRVADGLDAGHQQKLQVKGCTVGKKKIVVHLDNIDQAPDDVRAANKKGDLFRKVFNKELEFE
jgi:putative phosphoesterase